MRTIKCDQPGCDFVARHNTDYVRCIIGRHRSIKHGIRGKMFKYSKQGKLEASTVASSEPREPEVEPVNIPNFCPNCGCSISAIMAAMNLRRKR